ncbi:DUF3000 domain-containing protein [Raineyella fluvialis]|uniref:DUF3000 family protein n=1 Tax=Raineyella fluvialis TaxID=2662261 RepID=A0A5Q2FD65_9ACTN|nr:DUF3000 domain-containing protein [Raineyella fluvialis]QGF24749.1 DUF3000 family protein [Raineyella fluvialis]
MVDDLRAHSWRPGLSIEEVPSPQRVAPYAVAFSADLTLRDQELGTGRLVILHDPEGVDSWQGTFRVVAYAKGDAEPEMVTDTMAAEVGWSWLLEALDSHHAAYVAPSGNVACTWSRSFGGLEQQSPQAQLEVRASWTPVLDADGAGIDAHLDAFAELLCATCGIPPLPEGVVMMTPLRQRRQER